ncbi:MAG TPA: hypothetical protein VI282_14275 [Verrucomicrobiae bacterium]|jgi:hypothetical protein
MIDPNDTKKPEQEQKPDPTGSNKPLSPEEQMEQFEEDLKENDWGHQPC